MVVTEDQVREIFAEFLPDVVAIVFVDKDTFIRESLLNPFIREQMRIGLYDEVNIHTDFLSVAKAYSLLRKIEVCLPLLIDHVAVLDEARGVSYIRWLAAHEAHHFEDAHMLPASDPRVQAMHEKDCNTLIEERYPHLTEAMTDIEKLIPAYQRVYARIDELAARREAQTN